MQMRHSKRLMIMKAKIKNPQDSSYNNLFCTSWILQDFKI